MKISKKTLKYALNRGMYIEQEQDGGGMGYISVYVRGVDLAPDVEYLCSAGGIYRLHYCSSLIDSTLHKKLPDELYVNRNLRKLLELLHEECPDRVEMEDVLTVEDLENIPDDEPTIYF